MYGVPATVARSRITQVVNLLDLASASDDLIETYSTGMKKKVAFAAAVLHRPDAVLPSPR